MKKVIKIFFIIIGIFIGVILLDTIQARVFKQSPFISWKEELEDEDSWVNRGILMDTYYCAKEQDIVTIYWKFKGNNYTCPIDNIKIKQFVDYDFSVTVGSNTNYEKIFAFKFNDINYYYGNTLFELSLIENVYKYDIETSLKNELIDFDDILNKAKEIESFRDGGSKLYKYDNFNIIVCNTVDDNNDVIIGDTKMQIDNYCK